MKKTAIFIASLISAITYADETYSGKDVNLKDTVISTSGFEESSKNVLNNVEIITSEDIEEHSYKTVTEILNNSPNVNLSYNSIGPVIDMRGQGVGGVRGNLTTTILVDGVALNVLDSYHGRLPIDTIDVNNIAKIEIIPGGGSILYGNGTAGGVINIITKNYLNTNLKNTAQYQIASYNQRKFDISAGKQLNKKLGFHFNYNKSDEDGYRANAHDYWEEYGISANYQINNKQKLNYSYSKHTGDKFVMSELTESQINENRRGENLDSDDGTQWNDKKETNTLSYSYNINSKLNFIFDSSYVESDNLSDNSTDFYDKKVTFKPKLNMKYANSGNLILGYDYIKNNGSRFSNGSGSVMERISNSIFALNKNRINNFEITEGIRFETADYNVQKISSSSNYDHSKDISGTALELGTNYLYSDTGNVYAKWLNGYTLPVPTMLVDKSLAGKYLLNDLDSEKFNTIEFGIKDFVGISFISVTAYYTITEDEIYWNSINHSTAWSFENLDETTRYGLELSANQTIGKFTLSEGAKYTQAKVSKGEYDGKYVPYVPKTSANIDIKYDFTDKISGTVSVNYKDKFYIDENNAKGKYNDQFITNLSGNYTIKEDLNLFGGINNLFSEKYYTSVSYTESATYGPYTIPESITYDPAAETTYYLGIKAYF